ncbi:RrF2 family transcriptional regulator [Candidatus Enterococcus murrayae]|uniref:Rrf2 family transcriptional regulator n=1 Tax=Candidatus Enterococcus murrayae TaxID=2815321 RepID=A0ABS3HCP1_9ENTE|nr:Rrf2 family transcriptional regulator [Enterococcus sp. MJM16]MBO0451213.1 Rrf2 family transcriptional regulator [Enterococcus sp. MJM16]
MKLSSSYVQAIGILVMLAELPEKDSLKSSEISKRMNVSHTYLQKIATKLKHANLIDSYASKQGGYKLKKPKEEINFLDVFLAIEGENAFLSHINLEPIDAMFVDKDLIREKSDVVKEIHSEAQKVYMEQLQSHPLTEILPKASDGSYLTIDWKKFINEE